jgi:hypothetical protein
MTVSEASSGARERATRPPPSSSPRIHVERLGERRYRASCGPHVVVSRDPAHAIEIVKRILEREAAKNG